MNIHIEPLDEFVRIRWRKDGVLHTAGKLPRQRLESLVSRIKVLAGLDIANRRLPQDGRIVWNDGRRRLDLRISTLPTVRGEKIVVRILDGKRLPLELSALGMDGEARTCLEKLVCRRQGLILICGPTGSGKTTTLYAALGHIHDEHLSIATLEDPVEILIDGLSQSQVQPKGGMVFQTGCGPSCARIRMSSSSVRSATGKRRRLPFGQPLRDMSCSVPFMHRVPSKQPSA